MAGTELDFNNEMASWNVLRMNPSELKDARLPLHYAAQLPASFGKTYSHMEGHERQALDFRDGELYSQAAKGIRVALDMNTLVLRLTGAENESIELGDRRFTEGFEWIEEKAKENRLRKNILGPEEMPYHPLAAGAKFILHPKGFKELVRYYKNSQLLLDRISSALEGSPVKIWPHQFDMDTKLSGIGMGAGFSPGDEEVDEPYWYVKPWDAPDDLPELPSGHWHEGEWTAAVLTASELLGRQESPDGQAKAVASFFSSAIRILRPVLE